MYIYLLTAIKVFLISGLRGIKTLYMNTGGRKSVNKIELKYTKYILFYKLLRT